MSHRSRRSSKQEFDGEFDITPMIDVVFLLLIFFIVTARMAPKNITSLPKAKFGETVAGTDSVVLNVQAGGGDIAIVKRKDGSLFSNEKEAQAVEIADYIHYGFEQKHFQYVMICAEPKVKSREIARLREIVAREIEPGQEILIAVQQ